VKKPFRFHRAELEGGYYLKNLLHSWNESVVDVIDELIYQGTFQWKLESEITAGELPIREDDLIGIGKFAGIFRPFQYQQNSLGSVRFTQSNVVGGAERSERGLYNVDNEVFEFVRTAQDDYPTDISTEALESRKMTLVPAGTVPVGYVKFGTDLFRADGTIITESILSAPPTDGAPYTEYYGDKYLFLEEVFSVALFVMTIGMFKKYYECLMRIRYNGSSVKELLYITSLLGEGYIYDIEVVQVTYYYTLYYSLNEALEIDNKSGRFSTWELVILQEYKMFTLVER